MFEERKTKFALLSLLALVVISAAFAGISIYAQTDEGEPATSEDNTEDDGSTSIAADEVSSLLEDLYVCDVGTSEISGETEIAAVADEDVPATVSVEVMTRAEVEDLAPSETETASDDETSTASAECVLVGGNDDDNDDSTQAGSSETAIASAPEPDDEILVIEGQGFVPGQVVLMFTENALVGIDDVDPDGNIEAKIPMPDSGTTIAGNDDGSIELRFLESGTQRTTTFEYDGGTLTAQTGGDIEAEGS